MNGDGVAQIKRLVPANSALPCQQHDPVCQLQVSQPPQSVLLKVAASFGSLSWGSYFEQGDWWRMKLGIATVTLCTPAPGHGAKLYLASFV